MNELELPDHPGSPTVRGLAACLASVTELPLDVLPQPPADATVDHAIAAWKTWLAGRNFGMVPIADPGAFQWAGYWIALVDQPDGPAACVAFGTPPGVVLSPQHRALLGRATADLPISSAYVVASLDPVLPPMLDGPELSGTVEQIAVAPAAGAPMRIVSSARALAGRGLEGDRYADGLGTFSPGAAHRPGYELTLFAAEVLDDLSVAGVRLDFPGTRRNILTRGIDVNALVGRDFRIGHVHCRGLRLAEPCVRLEELSGSGLLRPLIHQGGLRADILDDGEIQSGATVATV